MNNQKGNGINLDNLMLKKQKKIEKLAKDVKRNTEESFDSASLPKKAGKRKKIPHIKSSARFDPDLYEMMKEKEYKQKIPMARQYNLAIRYWFKNGCPLI